MGFIKLKVESPGPLTTVQDTGRHGYQQFGMPVGGAMDDYALRVGNLLAGNPQGEAGLEITFPGFSAVLHGTGRIAVTGADLGAVINDRPLKPWRSIMVEDGDRISFTSLRKGCRAYLCIEGGIDVPIVMGSRSTNLKAQIGGYGGRRIIEGDVLKSRIKGSIVFCGCIVLPEEYIPEYRNTASVRVVMGPQDDCFAPEEIDRFLSSEYFVTGQSDRMGYRLEGPAIKHMVGPDIISDGIALGAVQIPGHGQPIIMMRDHQTTGGYTKIANVISVDIPILAQMKPGDGISFTRISVEEAQVLYRGRERLIKRLVDYLGGTARFAHFMVRIGDIDFRIDVQEV